jgi:hypothetical protein
MIVPQQSPVNFNTLVKQFTHRYLSYAKKSLGFDQYQPLHQKPLLSRSHLLLGVPLAINVTLSLSLENSIGGR